MVIFFGAAPQPRAIDVMAIRHAMCIEGLHSGIHQIFNFSGQKKVIIRIFGIQKNYT
jgi:hypothetical protein